MREGKLDNMIKGWFVGNFQPTLFQTNSCEVAVKIYHKGDYESPHFHKIATEITVVIKGKVRMFCKEYKERDIIIVEPGDITAFEALEDTVNVVVKIPGANNDKYITTEVSDY